MDPRVISNRIRTLIPMLIAVMSIFAIILVMLKLYSSLGSLNWGVVFIPMYLILAMYHIEFHMCSNWYALLAIIATFTLKLNGERERVEDAFLVLLTMEGTLLFTETLVACRCIIPVPGDDCYFLYLIASYPVFFISSVFHSQDSFLSS